MKERLIAVYCSQPLIPWAQSPPEKWHLTEGNKLRQNTRNPKTIKSVRTSMADWPIANKEDASIRVDKGALE